MKHMDPLVGNRLRHPEYLPKDVLGSRLAQVHQDEQQFVFQRWEWAVLVGNKAPFRAFLTGQSPFLHLTQERYAKSGKQCLKLDQCVSCQGMKLLLFFAKFGIISHGGVPS
jgi:hypothetical protein